MWAAGVSIPGVPKHQSIHGVHIRLDHAGEDAGPVADFTIAALPDDILGQVAPLEIKGVGRLASFTIPLEPVGETGTWLLHLQGGIPVLRDFAAGLLAAIDAAAMGEIGFDVDGDSDQQPDT